ncbi:MAG: hypothetical protein ABEJ71_02700 [Halodesulfurarchaeum sp.]
MTSWTQFALAYLAVMVMFAGMAGFFAFNDKVTHYEYRGTIETPPRGGVEILTYEDLTSRERKIVDAALAGERTYWIFETRGKAPPPIVRKDGTYHRFGIYGTFDWLDYHTWIPVLVTLLGLAGAVTAVRWEIRGQVTR